MLRARPRGSRRGETTVQHPRGRARSARQGPAWTSAEVTAASSPGWPRDRLCCRGSPSRPKRSRRSNRDRDRGSATLLAVAMMGLIVAGFGAAVVVATAVVARHRAQSAADLAALAAAGRLATG